MVVQWMRIPVATQVTLTLSLALEDPTHGLVQSSHSVVSDSATPWTAAHQVSLSITNSQSLLKLMSIELVVTKWLVIQPFHPLSSPSPLTLNLSQHQGLFQ